jgi:hypothetical protein
MQHFVNTRKGCCWLAVCFVIALSDDISLLIGLLLLLIEEFCFLLFPSLLPIFCLLSKNENALDVVDDIKNENIITVRCSLYEQATALPKLSRTLVTLSLRFPFEKELF